MAGELYSPEVIEALIAQKGYKKMDRSKFSLPDVEKILSKYKIIEFRSSRARAIPAETEPVLMFDEIIEYVCEKNEELVVYDYGDGAYYYVTQDGPFMFVPSNEEKDAIRKALQDAL